MAAAEVVYISTHALCRGWEDRFNDMQKGLSRCETYLQLARPAPLLVLDCWRSLSTGYQGVSRARSRWLHAADARGHLFEVFWSALNFSATLANG